MKQDNAKWQISTTNRCHKKYTCRFLWSATSVSYDVVLPRLPPESTLRVRCSYCRRSTVHAVAAMYLQSTLNGIPTCSSLSGTTSYETYTAGQEESGYVSFDFRKTPPHSWKWIKLDDQPYNKPYVKLIHRFVSESPKMFIFRLIYPENNLYININPLKMDMPILTYFSLLINWPWPLKCILWSFPLR